MDTFLSHCVNAFSDRGGILLTFFLGGLTGGFTHCLTMCGPYVACERACAGKGCGAANKAVRATGLAYHLGRFTTYGMLGFAVALISSQIAASEWWPRVASGMLAAAGVLFLISCLRGCEHANHRYGGFGLTYLRGVLLGFLPCGLLYAALMMAATLAEPVSGMVAMWLFTLGTVPALLLVSGGADFIGRRWQPVISRIGRAAMAFNGLSLLVMAVKFN